MDGVPSPPSANSGAVILGGEAAEALQQAALRVGLLCNSCGCHMDGPGFEFISLRTKVVGERPTVAITRFFACHRPECAEAREKMRQGCTAVREAGGWTVFDKPEEREEEPAPEEEPG